MSLYEIDRDTQIDEFGVDHSNFSLRDEIEYNFRRAEEKRQQKSLMPQAYQVPRVRLQKMPKTKWNEVIMAGITGMGEGMIGGVERFADSLTRGEYGRKVDSIFDNAYTNRQNILQNRADSVGLGNANRLVNTAITVSGELLPLAYVHGRFIK